jgi:peptidoglycan/LPS O-acetylase OafA/YrhL
MPGKTRTRQEFIDVVRGFAMLFVLISHFSFTYFPDQLSVTPTVLRTIGMVASPTFMIINGLLIGFLCRLVAATSNISALRLPIADCCS